MKSKLLLGLTAAAMLTLAGCNPTNTSSETADLLDRGHRFATRFDRFDRFERHHAGHDARHLVFHDAAG